MSDIQVGEQWYRCGRMNTRTQLHVAKRLIPVMQGLMPLFRSLQSQMQVQQLVAEGGEVDPDTGEVMVPQPPAVSIPEAVAALSNTIGMLSDGDADYIMDAALSCVQWRQGARWIPLYAQGGILTNSDADDLAIQLRLLWEVLVQSLSNFSFATLLPSTPTNGLDQTATVTARN